MGTWVASRDLVILLNLVQPGNPSLRFSRISWHGFILSVICDLIKKINYFLLCSIPWTRGPTHSSIDYHVYICIELRSTLRVWECLPIVWYSDHLIVLFMWGDIFCTLFLQFCVLVRIQSTLWWRGGAEDGTQDMKCSVELVILKSKYSW